VQPRHREWLRFLAYQTLTRNDAQIPLKLSVNAIDPLVASAKLLQIAQIQKTQAKAPVSLILDQAQQPISNQQSGRSR